MPTPKPQHHWGEPPWRIDFSPAAAPIPERVDFAVVGAGFTGLAAAAWLRTLDAEKSVAVFEAGQIGAGASGRTGGMALAETAAGDLPGLGDALDGFAGILRELRVECDLRLPGAWEIARTKGEERSPIEWNDSGTLRVTGEVPGGTIDPGKLISGLGRAAQGRGAAIFEHARVSAVRWGERPELELTRGDAALGKVSAGKILFATNALSLPMSGLAAGSHPRLTLAIATDPLSDEAMAAIGLGERKPFYTADLPYLWGRACGDNSIVWGAGLVRPPESGDLEAVDVTATEAARLFSAMEQRVQQLHPALRGVRTTHRWGGPILFQESWRPAFARHAASANAIVLGAFAGHGVALSSYLGAWAAEALLGRRELPEWGEPAGDKSANYFL
ncbi:MAG TPA: FAD-binding oxidoreductase [Candidatus Acidoferrales bacterium]|nr:FAD-binding oxidoreductase [Candidatus Acidoferrales bacterium]